MESRIKALALDATELVLAVGLHFDASDLQCNAISYPLESTCGERVADIDHRDDKQ